MRNTPSEWASFPEVNAHALGVALEYCSALDPQSGVIKTPGRFEGEPLYVVYFYECVMEGWGVGQSDGSDTLSVSKAERALFHPWLKGRRAVRIWISNDGFVYDLYR